MKCPSCGAEFRGKFCTSCGTPTTADPESEGAQSDAGATTAISRADFETHPQQSHTPVSNDGARSGGTTVIAKQPEHSKQSEKGGFFQSLADIAVHRPWLIVILAIIFMSVSGILGGSVAKNLSGGGFNVPGSESDAAANRVESASGINQTGQFIALIRTGKGVNAAITRTEVNRVASLINKDSQTARVITYQQSHNPAMVSYDGKATYVLGEIKKGSDSALTDATKRLQIALAGDKMVKVGGGLVANVQTGDQVSSDLAHAELLAFPLLFILLLLVFRGLVAAFFPLLMGMITVLGAFLGLQIVNSQLTLSIFAVNLVTGLGLGLAIDYSLIISSRYREELGRVGPGREALRRTLDTAGRTVLFSALTVTAALASLLVFPQRFLVSMGIGGILVTIIGAAVALTVLPAILRLLGTRVNAGAPRRWQEAASRPGGEGFWYRLSRFVMRHAGAVSAVTALVLIILGLPFLRIKFTTVDATVLPTSLSARQVNEVLQTQFPSNRTTPITLIFQAPDSAGAPLKTFVASLSHLPGARSTDAPRFVGKSTWEADIISNTSAFSDSSLQLVKTLRATRGQYPFYVGGDSAQFMDQKASLTGHLWIALLIVAAVTVIVLFLATGSVALPIKSVIMNLLTLSATFGILVFIFQDGRLTSLLRYSSQGALDVSEPILIFVLAFGLSTDYGVFLLTRIKEQHNGGIGNTESVATGLQYTGRTVTAAALLFCVAIGAFTTSNIVFIKELGLGTALAVIIDATIVRALLVPSLMKLLGDWNWWAPRSLRRLYTRFKIEEGSSAAP